MKLSSTSLAATSTVVFLLQVSTLLLQDSDNILVRAEDNIKGQDVFLGRENERNKNLRAGNRALNNDNNFNNAAAPAPAPAAANQTTEFRWASTGGGWLAMSGDMALANVFARAGLFTTSSSDSSTDGSSSKFSAISTESGGSWFSTQFFYSPQFHDAVVNSAPGELADFTMKWMESYRQISVDAKRNPLCDLFGWLIGSSTPFDANFCNVLVSYKGNWADFVDAMFYQASVDYGDDGLVTRKADPQSKVKMMADTDLYIQMALASSSRTRNPEDGKTERGSSFGPVGQSENKVYSVPVTFQYSVQNEDNDNDGMSFISTGPNVELDIEVYATNITSTLDFPTGPIPVEYGFFPQTSSVLIDAPSGSAITGKMKAPFGGKPNIAQLASASSAAAAAFSPLLPSSFSQIFSYVQEILLSSTDQEEFLEQQQHVGNDRDGPNFNTTEIANILGFDDFEDGANNSSNNNIDNNTGDDNDFGRLVNGIYSGRYTNILNDFSVCAQWPNDCDDLDGRLLDGGYTDAATLALNLGQYQMANKIDDAGRQEQDNQQPLKFVVTLVAGSTTYGSLLSYFETDFNKEITPGETIWPKDGAFPLPIQSPQIFGTYEDSSTLNFKDVQDSHNVVEYTTISTTTIDNPAYHVKAGQDVELLVLSLKTDIPVVIVGTELIDEWTQPLAELVEKVSASDELVEIVESFFFGA